MNSYSGDLLTNTITTLGVFGIAIILESSWAMTQGSKPELSMPDENNSGEICIANISPQERLKRLIGGVIPFVIALSILTWQISTDVERLWRLPLFFLFVGAASGYFQWRGKT